MFCDLYNWYSNSDKFSSILKSVYYRLHLHETKGGRNRIVKTQLSASQKFGKTEKTNRNY